MKRNGPITLSAEATDSCLGSEDCSNEEKLLLKEEGKKNLARTRELAGYSSDLRQYYEERKY